MTIRERVQKSRLLLGDCLEEAEILNNTVQTGAVSAFALDHLRLAGTYLHSNRRGRRADAVKLLVSAREDVGYNRLKNLILKTILSLTF